MPRNRPGEGDLETLGRAYTRGYGVPHAWKREARCRAAPMPWAQSLHRGGRPGLWLVDAKDEYLFDDAVLTGAQLQEIAIGICSLCPVQWDCLAAALQAEEPVGVWGGLRPEERLWLLEHGPSDLVETARADGRPVQFALRDAKEALIQAC